MNRRSQIMLALAVGALLIPVFVFWLERDTKALDIVMLSSSQLIGSTSRGAVEDLEISFKGEPIDSLTALTFAIKNSGSSPITSGDFEEPLAIAFGSSARVLTAKIEEVEPHTLHPSVVATNETLTLQPLLLNPGDEIKLSSYVAGNIKPPSVSYRIIGIREARVDHRALTRHERRAIRAGLTGTLGLLAYFYLGGLAAVQFPRWRAGVVLPSMEVAGLLLLTGVGAVNAAYLAAMTQPIFDNVSNSAIVLGVGLPFLALGGWRAMRSRLGIYRKRNPASAHEDGQDGS